MRRPSARRRATPRVPWVLTLSVTQRRLHRAEHRPHRREVEHDLHAVERAGERAVVEDRRFDQLGVGVHVATRAPVERSSITRVEWPSATSASTRWEPMNPAPPVTSTFMRPTSSCGDHHCRSGAPASHRLTPSATSVAVEPPFRNVEIDGSAGLRSGTSRGARRRGGRRRPGRATGRLTGVHTEMVGLHVVHVIDSLVSGGAESSLAVMAPELVARRRAPRRRGAEAARGVRDALVEGGANVIELDGDRRTWWRSVAAHHPRSAARPRAHHAVRGRPRRAASPPGSRTRRSCRRWRTSPTGPSTARSTRDGGRACWAHNSPTPRPRASPDGSTRCPSRVADTMATRLRYPRSRIDVIPRGRDERALGRRTDERRERARLQLGIDPSVPLVLAIARQEHAKGLDVLIDTLAPVRHQFPTARYVVAGRAANASDSLHAHLRGTNDASAFTFLGARTDVAELLCAADVFVLPSRREGLPGALLEAMALECPAVVSNLPQIREVVDESTALLVPPDAVASLETAIRTSLADPVGARQRAIAARERFVEHFTIGPVVERMIAFYERALRDWTRLAALAPLPGARASPGRRARLPRRRRAHGSAWSRGRARPRWRAGPRARPRSRPSAARARRAARRSPPRPPAHVATGPRGRRSHAAATFSSSPVCCGARRFETAARLVDGELDRRHAVGDHPLDRLAAPGELVVELLRAALGERLQRAALGRHDLGELAARVLELQLDVGELTTEPLVGVSCRPRAPRLTAPRARPRATRARRGAARPGAAPRRPGRRRPARAGARARANASARYCAAAFVPRCTVSSNSRDRASTSLEQRVGARRAPRGAVPRGLRRRRRARWPWSPPPAGGSRSPARLLR